MTGFRQRLRPRQTDSCSFVRRARNILDFLFYPAFVAVAAIVARHSVWGISLARLGLTRRFFAGCSAGLCRRGRRGRGRRGRRGRRSGNQREFFGVLFVPIPMGLLRRLCNESSKLYPRAVAVINGHFASAKQANLYFSLDVAVGDFSIGRTPRPFRFEGVPCKSPHTPLNITSRDACLWFTSS